MKHPPVQYLHLISASICFAFVTLTPTDLAAPVHLVQGVSNYYSYMKLGYAATQRRDYLAASVYFNRALQTRPGDRYAISAIKYVQSKITFILPKTGAPSKRQDAGARKACLSEKALIALMPESPALTTAEYPLLFFYVPKTSAQMLQLSLLDESNGQRYSATVATPQTPGIVSINLSTIKDLPPLEIGKNYHWYFEIICDSQNRSANVLVDGVVQRIELSPVLASSLTTASLRGRVSLYVENRIWYDALAALLEARQASPKDSVLADEWAELLKLVGLDTIAREPLVRCCTVRN